MTKVRNLIFDMNKIYTTAPLPFMGQKRRFLNQFKKALNEYNDASIFVDLFGGSGFLSHIAKHQRPDARVIYNDYDDYHVRLEHVQQTNRMMADLRAMLAGCPVDKKLSNEMKQRVINYLTEQEKTGFVDYITLSSSLLFSMNYATTLEEFSKQTMYNCVKKADYDATGYLEGLEVVKYDYKALFEKFKGNKDVVFFVDPPYLSTDNSTYKNYWRLADYLDVLKVLKDTSYFYFTSNKSNIIELCDWIEINLAAENPFKNAVKTEARTNVTYAATYTDIMLHKRYVTSVS
jgi:site-specific DNA-adenine methylase